MNAGCRLGPNWRALVLAIGAALPKRASSRTRSRRSLAVTHALERRSEAQSGAFSRLCGWLLLAGPPCKQELSHLRMLML